MGSFAQGGIDLLKSFGYLAHHLGEVPPEVRNDVAQFILNIRSMMYADGGNLGADGLLQGRGFDFYVGTDSSTTVSDLLLHKINYTTDSRANESLATMSVPGFPRNLMLRADGQFIEKEFQRYVDVIFARNSDGSIKKIQIDGALVPQIDRTIYHDGAVGVVKEYVNNRAISTNIRLGGNPLVMEFSDAGAALGQQLGLAFAKGSQLAGIVSSAALQTIGDNLGDVLDGLVGGQAAQRATKDAFSTLGPELVANLKAAGVGALSSFMTAELVKAVGVDGFAGELINSAGGQVIQKIIGNLGSANPFSGIDYATSVGSSVGSFLGAKLAAQVLSFNSLGGQVGSAVGSSLGTLIASTAIDATIGGVVAGLGISGAAASLVAGALTAGVGAFVGFLVGGLIGSVFGGTPRSGADVAWNEVTQSFEVANAYSRKGGSKESASGLVVRF